jgi:hypothetical protein
MESTNSTLPRESRHPAPCPISSCTSDCSSQATPAIPAEIPITPARVRSSDIEANLTAGCQASAAQFQAELHLPRRQLVPDDAEGEGRDTKAEVLNHSDVERRFAGRLGSTGAPFAASA